MLNYYQCPQPLNIIPLNLQSFCLLCSDSSSIH
uniref:Uncharacterized protein n=1 Tax=Rhizophora mucronata TaxID=61149 RepID=A0A2P2L4D1_RHIMU